MRRWRAVIVMGVAACARDAAPPRGTAWHDETAHRTAMVTVAPGVQLETVDWGGSGPPLVLLAGLSNTAHVYDEFAPKLTDSFHVVGITRRGFGASSQPPAGDPATMVADLRAVLDSLHLGRIVLAGHSIAGDELTPWAATAGDQCAGLVYLDAAHDRSGLLALFTAHPPPNPPPPAAADSASADAMQAYVARAWGQRVPRPEIHNVFVFDSSGRLERDVTPDSIAYRVLPALVRPDYRRIQCPALAIYAVADSVQDLFPNWAVLDSAARTAATAFLPPFDHFARTSREQFRRELRGGRVIELHGADHYVFISREAEVLRAIRSLRRD